MRPSKENKVLPSNQLQIGELYLFHPHDRSCPADGSLWGIFDKRKGPIIYLETSSQDLTVYRRWHQVPELYRYCRLATRAEIMDYMYNLGAWEFGSICLREAED